METKKGKPDSEVHHVIRHASPGKLARRIEIGW